jgi:hypothetical protein
MEFTPSPEFHWTIVAFPIHSELRPRMQYPPPFQLGCPSPIPLSPWAVGAAPDHRRPTQVPCRRKMPLLWPTFATSPMPHRYGEPPFPSCFLARSSHLTDAWGTSPATPSRSAHRWRPCHREHLEHGDQLQQPPPPPRRWSGPLSAIWAMGWDSVVGRRSAGQGPLVQIRPSGRGILFNFWNLFNFIQISSELPKFVETSENFKLNFVRMFVWRSTWTWPTYHFLNIILYKFLRSQSLFKLSKNPCTC